LEDADFFLVNLETIASSRGEPQDKREGNPYYFRARPELLNILSDAGINIVTGANNHAGDYGSEAILEQTDLLAKMGIMQVGLGRSYEEASRFKVIEKAGFRIAIVGVDMTMEVFNASGKPGTNYHSPDDPDAFIDYLKREVKKTEADLHLLTIHWGGNWHTEPAPWQRELARRILSETEIDAILGHSNHVLQGMEIINGKPVIYDAGNFIIDNDADNENHQSIVFKMTFVKRGVVNIELVPIKLKDSNTVLADQELGKQIVKRFFERSLELSDNITFVDNIVVISDEKPSRSSHKSRQLSPVDYTEKTTAVVPSLPTDANVYNHTFPTGMRLLGSRFPASIEAKRGFFLDTYWETDNVLSTSYLIYVELKPLGGNTPVWTSTDTFRDHQPADWSYPTTRWIPGEIVEDLFYVRGHSSPYLGEHTIYIGVYDPADPNTIYKVNIGQVTVVKDEK
jgi:hypothetical protein